MRQPRNGSEHLGRDVLVRDQELDRFEPCRQAGLDQVLALDHEEPGLVPLPSGCELANELQPRVCRGGDQLFSAALACSAILPKAAGSLTARSARTFRSS